MNNYNYNKLTPFKWFVLQNFPFIEADFDAITNYQLFCKLGEEINKVINSVNITGEQVENLTNAFNDLKNYVDEFFDDLNIQNEVNNKLDEMAESGELTELITSYLELKCIYGFNTVDEMVNSTNLVDGSFAKTYGKLSYNDGLGEFYKIREILNTDVVDGIHIIQLLTDNTLIAELIPDAKIEDITQDITDIQEDIGDIEEDITELNNKITQNYISVPNRYRIDCINGDDLNDGLTNETAWKTLDKFFELVNQGHTDIRCYLISSGTYKFSKNILNNVVLHITAQASNIILENENYGWTIYNSHVNIQGYNDSSPITIKNTESQNNIYFENCATALNNVTFVDCSNFEYFGSSLHAQRLTVPRLYLNGCNFEIYTLNITKSSAGTSIIVRRGSIGSIRGDITFTETEHSNTIFSFERSNLMIMSNVTNLGYITSGTGVNAEYSVIITGAGYWSTFTGTSATNNINHTLITTNSATLP